MFNKILNLHTFQVHPSFVPNLESSSYNLITDSEIPLVTTDEPLSQFYSLNSWLNPEIIEFSSISQAAKILKNRQRNWVNVKNAHFRRSSLISEALPKLIFKNLNFPTRIPKSPLGHWSLIDENTLICSTACSAKVPHGNYTFVEDKVNPPSRAYLKLWELFTYLGILPNKNSVCIDLGAAPGGWTWALSQLTNKIIAIDKSELLLSKNSKITYIKEDILKLNWLKLLSDANWIFCDAALDPDKIVPIFLQILDAHPNISFVCTLKQKGNHLTELTKATMKIAQSNLKILSSNKHEITWYKINTGTYTKI